MFISCGDILVDLFDQPGETGGNVSLNGHVGGSPFNVAVGLSRLGNSVGFLCKNSNDFIGRRIFNYIVENGVKTDWVIPSDLNSTLAMIKKNADGSANYAFYIDNTADVSLSIDELPEAFPDDLNVLHFGSYSTAVQPTSIALQELAKRESAHRVISYDPNIRASIQPDMAVWRETFTRLSQYANFVKASDEDIRLLFGDSKSFESFAVDTLAAGASAVAVTEGGDGATVYTADGRASRSKPISIAVEDTVGAGDTFQAASLHWLAANACIEGGSLNVDDANIQKWVDFAAAAAAITCTRKGADLPTLKDVDTYIATQE